MHNFSYSSPFVNSTFNAFDFTKFVCRFAALSNKTITKYGNEFISSASFVENNLPLAVSVKYFGYYGGTSVCLPRFYVGLGESSWKYTIFLITINFVCFLCIAVSYFLIYKYSSESSKIVQSTKSKERMVKMQKKIARIIATDFCCWIPICIMAYVRLGVVFDDLVYQISAVLLLPINSALNPFLYSSIPENRIFVVCDCVADCWWYAF